MKPFTVFMLYPDYLADNYGEETYLAHVEADNLHEAINVAQHEAAAANDNESPEDFSVLFACFGHVDDMH